MSAGSSPLQARMIFVVGAQRSGTKWLQRILSTHPAIVAIPSETHLFSHGIAPLLERFHHGVSASPRTGLVYMDRLKLMGALRIFCDEVFVELAASLDPQADRILERTPWNVHYLRLISELYPDAAVIHIIRDGRDVARSQVAQEWGPQSMSDAAREWADAIRDARSAAVPHYREIRYEALLADPAGKVSELFHWLELPVNPLVIDTAIQEARLAHYTDRGSTEIREGKWRSQLTADELADFDGQAGDVLHELGYPSVAPVGATPSSGPPAPGGSVRQETALRRAATKLRGRLGERRSEPPASSTRLHMESVAELADRFLQSVALRRYDELAAFVRPATEVVLGSHHDHRRIARGDACLEPLVAALRTHEPARHQQISGDLFANPSGATAVLAYAGMDGSRSDAVFIFGVDTADDAVWLSQIAYYQLPGTVG